MIGLDATDAVSFAFGLFNPLRLASVNAFNNACCFLVFFITAYKRLAFTRSKIARQLVAA